MSKSGTEIWGRGRRDACSGTWDVGTRDVGRGDVISGKWGRDSGTRGRDIGDEETQRKYLHSNCFGNSLMRNFTSLPLKKS